MKYHNLIHRSLLAPAVALLLCVGARAEESTTNTIKFSDPSKPGTVKINLGRGDLRIQGSDTSEVSVKSEAKAVTSKPRKDGLRVISAASSFSMTEKDNVVSLDSAGLDWGKGNADFHLTVPRNATVIVQSPWGGDITCGGISGDIEINCMHGEIKLDDVAGGVVVGTMNGEIRANIRELREGKPLSFTSMNGEVQLRLPENAKANLRLRTQNGSVLTDFDESILVTKAEAVSGFARGKSNVHWKDGGSKVLSAEIQDSIREATTLGVMAVKEALEAVKEGLEEARLNSDEARRQFEDARRQIERARRDAERARVDSERERREVARSNQNPEPKPAATPDTAVPAAPPRAPMPPKIPSIPTISGGKLVTGTLNGGGPEISVATMNGDVILRKTSSAK